MPWYVSQADLKEITPVPVPLAQVGVVLGAPLEAIVAGIEGVTVVPGR